MQQKPAVTSVSIHELLTRRWSPRAIDPAQPVARAQLVALLEAARSWRRRAGRLRASTINPGATWCGTGFATPPPGTGHFNV